LNNCVFSSVVFSAGFSSCLDDRTDRTAWGSAIG